MLRPARSMPSLRTLQQVVQRDIQQHSKAFSSAATKYHLVIPDIPDYKHDVRQYQTFTRSVHQTAKKNQTPIMSKKSEFSLMSLNTLKAECRKRGLKVSGRKADLVSRISNYESSFSSQSAHAMFTARPTPSPSKIAKDIKKAFSQSTKPQAKGDDSHIDFIKPVDIEPPKLVKDDYIIKIPSLSTDASQTLVTESEKQLTQPSNPNETVVSKAPLSDTKIFEQSSVKNVEEQNVQASINDVGDLLGLNEPDQGPYEYDYSEVPKGDKRFLAGFLGAVGLWWLLPKGKKAADKIEEVKK